MTGNSVSASYRESIGTDPQPYAVAIGLFVTTVLVWLTFGVNLTDELPDNTVMVALIHPALASFTAAHAHVPGPAASWVAQSNIGTSGPVPLAPRVC